jgi:hypothetical protein
MTRPGVTLLAALLVLARPASAQAADSAAHHAALSGAFTVTTKGISTIPSFTLGRPAAILDVSIAKRGFSFDPQFRFGLDGKPWSFLFWGRYRMPESGRLHLTVGAHPAFSFRTLSVATAAGARDVIVVRRYLAGELSPSYSLSRRVSLGPYYLYSYGVERDVEKHTHFLSLRGSVSTVGLSDPYVVRLSPQIYYLKTGDQDGYYLNSALTLARSDLPFSISTTANKPMRTTVRGGDDFLWNVSLHYAIR